VPLTFLAIIAPALRTLGPCGRGTGLGDGGAASGMDALEPRALIAGLIGMVVGAEIERRMTPTRRAAAQGSVMSYSDAQIWIIIALLGVGTFLIRFSFLGLIGKRELPEWLLRHLRYTAVAILPAMVAPLSSGPPPMTATRPGAPCRGGGDAWGSALS
jgi:hypothetical protein